MKNEMNLHQRILSVFKIVKSVVKDGEIEQGNNTYLVVTHDSVARLLHAPVAEAGILCWPNMESCEVTTFEKEKEYQGKIQKQLWYRAEIVASVTFINADRPEEKLVSSFTSYAFDTSDKAVGKAYSMAIKNIYLKTFMLESLDAEESRDFDGAEYKQKNKPLPNADIAAASLASNKEKPLNHAPNSNNGKPLASEAQIKRLWAMSKKLKWTNEFVFKFVKENTEGLVSDPAGLDWKQYKYVTDKMESIINMPSPPAHIEEIIPF